MWPDTDKIALTAVRFPPMDVQPIDENHQLYGNFIGVQFVFEETLDPTTLAESIDFLILQHPELTGKYAADEHHIVPGEDHVWLRLLPNYEGHARDHATVGTAFKRRREFIYEPSRRDVQRGQAILSSFMLTTFENGGCIFSMGVSHLLVDAAGFHMLAQYLGEIYSCKVRGDTLPHTKLLSDLDVFKFGRSRTAALTSKALKKAKLAKPLKLKGVLGGVARSMIIKSLDGMANYDRVVFALSADEVTRLKRKVWEESGEKWISTNIALCAHFTTLMADFMFPHEAAEKVQIAQLLDIRGGYFYDTPEEQARFMRNAILIDTETAEFEGGLQEVSRADMARFFKASLAKVDAAYLQDRLDLISDCLSQGFSYPGLDFKTPTISLNNQSKMKVYNAQFAGQTPLRIVPQDVGDNVMFFPTPDGGIEVYIRDIVNPERKIELTTEEWVKRVYEI